MFSGGSFFIFTLLLRRYSAAGWGMKRLTLCDKIFRGERSASTVSNNFRNARTCVLSNNKRRQQDE